MEYEEDEEHSKKKKKKKVKEMVADDPRARTSTRFHGNDAKHLDRKTKGNVYKKKGHHANLTGSGQQEFHSNDAPHLDRGSKGDSLTDRRHKQNLTRSGRGEWHETPPTPQDDNKSDHRTSKRSNRV